VPLGLASVGWTYVIVMGSLALVLCGAVMAFFEWVVPAQERRLAERALLAGDSGDEEARRIRWNATRSPEDCPHDDVLENRDRRLENWSETFAPPAVVIDQGGLCRECGARVIRHGRPSAWTPWMLDPEEVDGYGGAGEAT
jgi:hypothetical protein